MTEAQKNKKKTTKSTKYEQIKKKLGWQNPPLLKRSWWCLKLCGGLNKTGSQLERNAAVSGEIKGLGKS